MISRQEYRDSVAGTIIFVATKEQDHSDEGHKRFLWLVDRLLKHLKRLEK